MARQLRTQGIKKMKLSFAFLAFLLFASCSNITTPGSSNNNSNGGQFGADYLPLTDNTVWTGHVTGSAQYLDANGNVTQTDEVDQDYSAALGFVETRAGKSVYPLILSDKHGSQTVGYGGILDSEVFGLNEFSNDAEDAATILPRVLTVGQTWTPAPEALPIQCQAKLVQRLAQFTTKGGTPYNEVIQVFATYLDSTSQFNQYDSTMTKYSANADLYFANGVGLVEADVHSVDYIEFDIYGGTYYDFYHTISGGTVWRKD